MRIEHGLVLLGFFLLGMDGWKGAESVRVM